MSLFDTSQLRKYRYRVASCIIDTGSGLISLRSMNVTGLTIVDNYVKNVFPVLKLNLAVEHEVEGKIISNKTSIRVKLTVNKYSAQENEKGEMINKSPESKWLDDYYVILPDDIGEHTESDLELLNSMRSSDDRDPVGDDNKFSSNMELYLFKEQVSHGMKKKINGVFEDCDLSTIISWALSESGINNCLMSPLENGNKYDRIWLPPIEIDKLLRHLDAMYGFYQRGSIIYFGAKRSYIINFKAGCTAYESNEKQETMLLIPRESSTENSSSGGVIEKGDAKNYLFIEYKDVQFSSPSIVEDVTKGSSVTVVERSSAKVTSASGKSTVTRDGTTNSAVIDNPTSNEWWATTYAAQSSSRSAVITASVVNADIDFLTPNKDFTVVLEDQTIASKYKGHYRLLRAIHNLVNTTADGDFGIVSAITLAKMDETTSSEVSMS